MKYLGFRFSQKIFVGLIQNKCKIKNLILKNCFYLNRMDLEKIDLFFPNFSKFHHKESNKPNFSAIQLQKVFQIFA